MAENSDYPSILSLFPLQTVLFPGNKLPLRIFEPRYVDLVGRCMREQQAFGIVGISSGQEAGAIPEIFDIGTEVHIIDFDQGKDGLLNIVVEAARRFRVNSTRTREDNLLTAAVTFLPALVAPTEQTQRPNLDAVFAQLIAHPDLADKINPNGTALDKAYEILSFLPLANAHKVALLGAEDALTMLSELEHLIGEMRRSAE